MKILVTGSNGLLGQKLVKLITSSGTHELIATARGTNRLPFTDDYIYETMDITNADQVMSICSKHKPETIIHTAAMTNVDTCETDREECWKMNVDAVKNLVEAARHIQAHLVHVSTDFIFDGSQGPLTEEAKPAPVNFYGESKLAAEQIVQQSNISWSIARTVLVYGIAHDMSRSNIILWVKNSLENQKNIQVVNDQWRTPTLAEDLAMGCLLLAEKKQHGVYNISGKDMLTPYEMALATAEFFRLDKNLITETDGSKFKQTAKRPPKTGFIIDKARRDIGFEPHSFMEGLAILRDQLTS
ncbi:SDR family oxidoreductase [Fulvivirga sedimenti]|uniref:dTDP-4-dehydrorhamnose reductase n=1 Tax=Fulvivirga sedimenti TaxID=2879465 RepID=A0A9X1HTH6_9BACT|nr:SDR family oxidoreductase [Fulvivirga sedimenti]MCA6078024.1 SDR family oxidoreductase [Fulvivirga sedimenti]